MRGNGRRGNLGQPSDRHVVSILSEDVRERKKLGQECLRLQFNLEVQQGCQIVLDPFTRQSSTISLRNKP